MLLNVRKAVEWSVNWRVNIKMTWKSFAGDLEMDYVWSYMQATDYLILLLKFYVNDNSTRQMIGNWPVLSFLLFPLIRDYPGFADEAQSMASAWSASLWRGSGAQPKRDPGAEPVAGVRGFVWSWTALVCIILKLMAKFVKR